MGTYRAWRMNRSTMTVCRGSDDIRQLFNNGQTHHGACRAIEQFSKTYGSLPELKSYPIPYIPFGYFEIFYPFYEMKHGQIVGMVM